MQNSAGGSKISDINVYALTGTSGTTYYAYVAGMLNRAGGLLGDCPNSNSSTTPVSTTNTVSKLIAETIARIVSNTPGGASATATYNLPGCPSGNNFYYKKFNIPVGQMGVIVSENAGSASGYGKDYMYGSFEGPTIDPDHIGEASGSSLGGSTFMYILGGSDTTSPECWGMNMLPDIAEAAKTGQ
jgi:hypothetical protein